MSDVQKMIRVLVVDDSAFMRKAISNLLVESPEFLVVATAKNGEEALQKVEELKPDVMTLDIDMPGMDGLTVLERVMESHPLPVLMVSSQTEDGAAVTVRALELGAVDFIPKHLNGSSLNISTIRDQMHEKVRMAAQAKGKVRRRVLSASSAILSAAVGHPHTVVNRPTSDLLQSTVPGPRSRARANTSHISTLLAIGCSTGGPQALQEVLTKLPGSLPAAVVIAQHMPKFFTKPFSERLHDMCGLEVREAQHGDEVKVGLVLIAPGGQHMTLKGTSEGVRVQISPEPAHLPYRPSVDLMLASAGEIFGEKVLSVVLTGMGQDGLEGARAVRANGGKVIAQDEASCIVYGMPKAVAEHGCADRIVSLSSMSQEVESQIHSMQSNAPGKKEANLTGASLGT